jgi:4-amino-4-deoxy-L-arabinose transferase-like glycosyltransferase
MSGAVGYPPLEKRLTRFDLIPIVAILAWGLVRLAPDIAHESIWGFDESFHQVVTRHVYDHPMTPTLSDDPVHGATDLTDYWQARVWLIKPPGAFWFGALMMALVGKVPLAFRIGGLLSQLLAGVTLYAFASKATKRLWAFLASVAYLSLPAGWVLTQARFVGDELDLMLCGCLCLAMLCLFMSVARDSVRWAALAGMATGAGFLVKVVLALTPIGVAGSLWVLSRVGFCRGPRLKSVAVLVAAAIAVAAPWNVYAARKWPAVYAAANSDILAHVLPSVAQFKTSQWRRPADAVFNELNQSSYEPMPQAFVLLAGIALLVRAIRRREVAVVVAALWLWATWLGHSLVAVKMHSHLWNSLVAGFIGMAVLLDDVWTSAPLGLATIAASTTPFWMAHFPALGRLRTLPPKVLEQTRSVAGLVEGMTLVVAVAALGWLLQFLLQRRGWAFPRWVPAAFGVVAGTWAMVWKTVSKQSEVAVHARAGNNIVHSREVGQALAALTPKQSIVMLDCELGPPDQIEFHNLMFWSDRVVNGGRDPKDYPQAGFHPYLVSPSSEPFTPLPVPADAWLRAYDMTAPAPEAQPLPPGVQPLDVRVGNLRVLGVARGRSDGHFDHYAFYVHSEGGAPGALPVSFQLGGARVDQVVQPEASLRSRWRLAQSSWFIMPVIGPPASEVREIAFGPAPQQRVVLEPSAGTG